jgi:hypothetical protein
VVHAYQVNALRQALKQGRDRTGTGVMPSPPLAAEEAKKAQL